MAQDVPIGATQVSLAQLNERSREIFRRIVESYLATGEPVGSRNLSRIIPMTLSPASVRNVMQDLEQLGLIYAPHTSAGRLPTETGLRFFVDALMQIGDLTESDRRAIEGQVAAAGKSVEGVLNEASGLLSGLSHSAGVVLSTKSDPRLKHIEFVRLEPERALVVLVAEDGQVENRILSLPRGLPTSALIEASNFLNAHMRGKTLTESKVDLERTLEAARAEIDELTQRLIADGLASWSGGAGDERKLIVRGHANLLDDLTALGISSACVTCSMIWRPSASLSGCSVRPSAPMGCGSTSGRRTSCSRSRGPQPSSRRSRIPITGSSGCWA